MVRRWSLSCSSHDPSVFGTIKSYDIQLLLGAASGIAAMMWLLAVPFIDIESKPPKPNQPNHQKIPRPTPRLFHVGITERQFPRGSQIPLSSRTAHTCAAKGTCTSILYYSTTVLYNTPDRSLFFLTSSLASSRVVEKTCSGVTLIRKDAVEQYSLFNFPVPLPYISKGSPTWYSATTGILLQDSDDSTTCTVLESTCIIIFTIVAGEWAIALNKGSAIVLQC